MPRTPSKATNTEILAQRTRIGELFGEMRDLQAEWAEEAIQRITTENIMLKQRVGQLTADNCTLDEPRGCPFQPPLPRPARRRPRALLAGPAGQG